MNNSDIAKAVKAMAGREDLLSLLNGIKKDEMERIGFADKFHPFPLKLLLYYCNPNNAFHRFTTFRIKKKSGGFRQITAPRNPSFMLMLRCLNILLKAIYSPSDYAMGFTEGRSVVHNADRHKGMNYVFNTDLKDFFPSIDQARVWKRLQLPPFSLAPQVANVVAGLCAMKGKRAGEDKFSYFLPQGSPVSPLITNMICDKLDRRLAGLARRFNLHYSRYADDITFSSMHNVYQPAGDFRKELQRIIEGQGFKMNEAKTRLQKRGARQEVTGIVVSDKLNVPRQYVVSLRNLLYIWDRYGYSVALSRFLPKYMREKGHLRRGNPCLENVVSGKLDYLRMVKGENDPVYQKLYAKYLTLVKPQPAAAAAEPVAIGTMRLEDFEKSYGVKLEFKPLPPRPGVFARMPYSGRMAYFQLAGKEEKVWICRLTPDEIANRKGLSVSVCRREDKVYWVVHKEGHPVYPDWQPAPNPSPNPAPKAAHTGGRVDVDELNNDLDSLLN